MILPGRGSGVLPVDKPRGPTSHDVVSQVRRALGTRRIGHTGTLDPFASGLLLLCVGRATRLAEYLVGLPKSYEARACLGRTTTTLDPDGEVVDERAGAEDLTQAEVVAALASLEGEQEQRPPAFSAKKIGGEAAHRRARRGEAVELPSVRVVVHTIELVSYEPPDVRFRARVSSGTYVRALARDLGERLGIGAHLTALRRTEIGAFRVERAIDPAELGEDTGLDRWWVPPLEAVAHLPRVHVGRQEARALRSGRHVPVAGQGVPETAEAVVVSCDGDLVAIGRIAEGRLRPRKVFAE